MDKKPHYFGSNRRGQLGAGTDPTFKVITVREDDEGRDYVAAAMSDQHGVFLTESGSVYAAGANDFGQLGDDSTTPKTELTEVETIQDIGERPKPTPAPTPTESTTREPNAGPTPSPAPGLGQY